MDNATEETVVKAIVDLVEQAFADALKRVTDGLQDVLDEKVAECRAPQGRRAH